MQTDSRDRLTVPGDQEECVDSGMNWDIGAAALGSQKKLRPKGEGCSERGTAPAPRTSSASAEAPQSHWAALNSGNSGDPGRPLEQGGANFTREAN